MKVIECDQFYMATQLGAVDRAAEPGAFIRYLDMVSGLEAKGYDGFAVALVTAGALPQGRRFQV